ncbi:MAG: hypothetical protein ACREP7_21270 [Lysobacter sp.]
MTTTPAVYRPIDCELHDVLESLATTRTPARIAFHDGSGAVQRCDAVIADVFARNAEEFLTTTAGESVRLDRLLSVDVLPVDDRLGRKRAKAA